MHDIVMAQFNLWDRPDYVASTTPTWAAHYTVHVRRETDLLKYLQHNITQRTSGSS